MSSSDESPLSYTRIASSRYGTSSRLTMNAVESFVCTGVLPTASTHSVAVFTEASSVKIVRTTSTSFISATGLKKCSPSTCAGRPVAAAIAVTLHDEVFEARIALGAQILWSLANVSFLSAWLSVIASTTRSHELRSSSRVVPAMRASAASLALASSLPRLASPSSVSRSRPSPRLTSSSLASTNRTSNPACADTCTIPEPMRPQPMTPTFVMAMPERSRLLPDATGQRRELVVSPGRTGISDCDRHRAVAHAAVGLDLAIRSARRRSGLLHRPIERGVPSLGEGRRDAEQHRGPDWRLCLVRGGRRGPRDDQDQETGEGGQPIHRRSMSGAWAPSACLDRGGTRARS